jgi:hypothetical protein
MELTDIGDVHRANPVPPAPLLYRPELPAPPLGAVDCSASPDYLF